jgi:hypothetical protein
MTSAGDATSRRSLGPQGRSAAGARGPPGCCGAVIGTSPPPVFRFFLLLADAVLGAVPYCAGSSGTGTQFPRNPHAEDVLVELAAELAELENNRL